MSEPLKAQFLQTITPFLYTDRALVQASNPATQALFSNSSDAALGDAGSGGQAGSGSGSGSDTQEVPLGISAAARAVDAVVMSHLRPLLLALLAWRAHV